MATKFAHEAPLNRRKVNRPEWHLYYSSRFGTGIQKTGLINQGKLIIGGTGLPFGSAMTEDSLGKFMSNISGANYAPWVEALQKAMLKYDITTPKRIAAFFAQMSSETNGLRDYVEKDNDFTIANLENPVLFGTRFTGDSGQKDAKGKSLTWAQYLGRESFKSPLLSEEKAIQIANIAYAGKNGNGNIASNDGWNYRGRGPFHLTGRDNYSDFAGNAFGKGSAEYNNIMNNPSSMDSNFYLLALSATEYWSRRVGNVGVDALAESSSVAPIVKKVDESGNDDPNGKLKYFSPNQYTDNVTKKIASDITSFIRRFNAWRTDVDLARTGGNPYENIAAGLNKVGFQTSGQSGYQNGFGISLRPPTRQPIVATKALNLEHTQAKPLVDSSSSWFESDGAQLSVQSVTNSIGQIMDAIQSMTSGSEFGQATRTVNVEQGSPSSQARVPKSIGICEVVDNSFAGELPLTPVAFVNGQITQREMTFDYAGANVSIVAAPKHGTVVAVSGGGDLRNAKYVASVNFVGRDVFTLRVLSGRSSVLLRYDILVTADHTITLNDGPKCRGLVWVISEQELAVPEAGTPTLENALVSFNLSGVGERNSVPNAMVNVSIVMR